jgi:hypothetical protein
MCFLVAHPSTHTPFNRYQINRKTIPRAKPLADPVRGQDPGVAREGVVEQEEEEEGEEEKRHAKMETP